MTWLSIIEYSMKHSLSPSTIRRKIRNGSINFKLEAGKYLIYDDPSLDKPDNEEKKNIQDVLAFTEKTLDEINRVNTMFIEEKERTIKEQAETIKKLHEEINELKMLVNVLEKGNNN